MATIALPQETIRVEVGFFSEEDRNALLKYPTADTLKKLTAEPIKISTAEFLVYYLFHRQRLGTLGYRNYSTVGTKLGIALSALADCVEFTEHSIATAEGVVHQLNEVTEHVGEAIGLSVMNRIHDVTEADWQIIPSRGGRGAKASFDFQLASDNHNLIEVENKGSSVSDNRTPDENVKAQKRKIAAKKEKLNAVDHDGASEPSKSLRYGTITVLDPRRDGYVRCWLTDPPADVAQNPSRFRLIQRMRFLRDWISFISPRSHLAVALATRVAALEVLENPFELDRVPLLRGNAERFELIPFDRFGEHSRFLAGKSKIIDGPGGGEIVRVSDRALFLLGIREELLVIAAEQDFQRLLAYKAPTGSEDEVVECSLSRSRARTIDLPSYLDEGQKRLQTVRFRARGSIQYSPAGLVFGVIPMETITGSHADR
jgi:hypothetical protein